VELDSRIAQVTHAMATRKFDQEHIALWAGRHLFLAGRARVDSLFKTQLGLGFYIV